MAGFFRNRQLNIEVHHLEASSRETHDATRTPHTAPEVTTPCHRHLFKRAGRNKFNSLTLLFIVMFGEPWYDAFPDPK